MKRLIFCMAIVSLLVLGCDPPAEDATYKVIYYGNGNTSGHPPTDNTQYTAGMEATVLGKGALLKDGYTFQHWNTRSDGTGTTYQEGDKIIIHATVFLHAQWEE